MRARDVLGRSDALGDDLKKVLPVTRDGLSDSATFDNVLEFLVMNGRSLPHAILMMIPEPWQNHESMSPERRAFYEYHASLMEPWDGPASIAFTDGTVIGAVLDRNGLRPSRYYVTTDGMVVMASEVGVLDIPAEKILMKERLHPGKIFLVDTAKGRIVDDEEIKAQLAAEHPYADWLRDNLVHLEELKAHPVPALDHATVLTRQIAFGYTHEDLRILLGPMAKNGEEPIGSMGTDTSLAVLSNRSRPLYDYFKQLFAQVTNPPLDQIREELVTSMESTVGPERNLLVPEPESCRQIVLKDPVITNDELAKLAHVSERGFKALTLPVLYSVAEGAAGLERILELLQRRASEAIAEGYNVIILSDRGISRKTAAIPSLLATASMHQHLVRRGQRTRCGLVIETGDAREVHHLCLLVGYGAGAVNPWVAFETIDDMISEGLLTDTDRAKAIKNYIKALNKGILKVMAKMGISTLQSYTGAQIFEAIGLNGDLVHRYLTGTVSRVSGIGLDVIADEVRRRHEHAFPERPVGAELDWGGEYQWRRDGEHHMVNPDMIAKLQHATRSGSYGQFKDFTRLCDDQSKRLATLRGLIEFRPSASPVPIEEVEPVESILKRFATGAMSYGSISQEAHETLAIAMNRIGGRSNTGEGGEDPGRYRRDPNGDWRRSAVKQVASGRFGVTSEYLVNATDLQIKMAQGAKPGEGGQLPGTKVYPWIAKVRFATPGVQLISPPPHHDIYSIEDIKQLIHDLKNANPQARVHVKLVAEVGVGTVAAGVAKAFSDVVLISGHDGGTGASTGSTSSRRSSTGRPGGSTCRRSSTSPTCRPRFRGGACGPRITRSRARSITRRSFRRAGKPSSTRSASSCGCRSATSTARWAPRSATTSRNGGAARGCPTIRFASASRARPGRASGRSSRAASPSRSRATPTTTGARASRVASSLSSRLARARSSRRTTSSSATWRSTGRPAVRRTCAASPASASASATAACTRLSRASAITAAST